MYKNFLWYSMACFVIFQLEAAQQYQKPDPIGWVDSLLIDPETNLPKDVSNIALKRDFRSAQNKLLALSQSDEDIDVITDFFTRARAEIVLYTRYREAFKDEKIRTSPEPFKGHFTFDDEDILLNELDNR